MRLYLCAAALAWSLALIPAALFVPSYSGQDASVTVSATGGVTRSTTHAAASLVAVNGNSVLILVALPAVAAAIVAASLGLRRRRIATIAVALLAGFNLIAMFTIGIFILPATALLVFAVLRAPTPQPQARPA